MPVFIGFTTRGPALEAVRVEALRQFDGVFGAPFPDGHLYDAIKGFFETGGQAAYVLRLTGAAASPARHVIETNGRDWVITARTLVADLVNLRAGEDPLQWQDRLIREYGQTIPDPGAWGNALKLRLMEDPTQSRPVATDAQDRRRLYPTEMTGMDAGALVKITQGAQQGDAILSEVDALRRRVTLDRDLPPGFDIGANETVQVSVQSMNAEILLNDQRVELFEGVSLSPLSARFMAKLVNAASQHIRIEPPTSFDPTQPDHVPSAGHYALSGGSDALTGQTVDDWRAALQAQSAVDEIALISAPDLVRQPPVPENNQSDPLAQPDFCHLPLARPKGNIVARIIDAETGAPLSGVRIEAAGEAAITQSLADGDFVLEAVSIGLVELRLSAAGYLPANPQVQSSVDQTADILLRPPELIPTLSLIARDEVPALHPADIETLQRAMCDPYVVGPYRIAVLDPPSPEATPEDLLNWVASMGQMPRAFAAAPWIGLPQGEGLAAQPPSGHVC
ncbi:MAG: carboxypeptidase regulatory-like domain-containing protein, partial [Rhodobacteraceae bacterium]|nr:carboxypeptidase regulatory-like domain-containing protein [Paracoccaceae bacterium]